MKPGQGKVFQEQYYCAALFAKALATGKIEKQVNSL